MGYTIGPILNMYVARGMEDLIMLAFAGTAIVFFACSAYVLTTKKDMSFLSTAIFSLFIVFIVRDCGKFLLPNSSTSGRDQRIVCGVFNNDNPL